jgi:hypothetical protein
LYAVVTRLCVHHFADPPRVRCEVRRALVRAGVRAGIELEEADGELRFVHRWLLLVAARGAL